MPNKEAAEKKTEPKRGEHEKKSKEQSADDEDRKSEKKLPEPPGNLRRRAEWFKKRH